MKTLLVILLITLAVMIWVAWARPWLKAKPWPWAQAFFAWIEPYEIKLWRKSETLLWARFKMALGMLVSALLQLGAIDLSPVVPFLPESLQKWYPLIPLLVTVAGFVDEKLRRDTTKPLDLVAVPETTPLPPAVAEALEAVETIKKDAVAVVKEAKKEGEL